MSTNHHALALEALRTAAQHVDSLKRQLDAEAMVGKVAQLGASRMLAELVRVTKRAPDWHLGHLNEAEFEEVRVLLDLAPADVQYRNHGNGTVLFILETTVAGVHVKAQRTAPVFETGPSPEYTAPEQKQIWIGDEAAQEAR